MNFWGFVTLVGMTFCLGAGIIIGYFAQFFIGLIEEATVRGLNRW